MSVDMDRVPDLSLGTGRSQELRLALAMRGGVSLAVWMGGACQEIEQLRSAADPDATAGASADVYKALLRAAGYDSVMVDVLAGTSAGGLNAVLLACSLVYGMPFDCGIRDLWLQVADIERLSRRPQDRTPPSLLRGDDVFYAELMANLRNLLKCWKGKTNDHHRVDLILTCTLLEPEADTFYQRVGAPIRDARSRAYFRFRHFGGDQAGASDFRPPDPSDSPSDPEVAQWEPLRRLAYAARSTSSYPVAFEPARIRVGHGEESSDNPESGVRLPRNMHDVFSESQPPPEETPSHAVPLVDGGVLDNIPIAWAIRSIAAAKANVPVDRWLLYLQPVPPRDPLLDHKPAAKDADDCKQRSHDWFPRLVGTAKKALGIKLASESLLDDVSELRLHAVRAEQRRQLADTIAASSSSLDSLIALAASEQALRAYRQRQGRVEAARLARLLEDPVQVTGPDPLPFGEPRRPLERLERMGPGQAAAFLAGLRADDATSENLPGDDVGELALPPVAHTHGPIDLFELRGRLRSLQTLARAVATLLDLAMRLERRGIQVEHDHDGELTKISAGRLAGEVLYPLRSAIELVIAAHDRLLLRRCAQISSGTAATPIDLAEQAAAELVHLAETTKLTGRLTAQDLLTRLCKEVTADCPVMLADGSWPSRGFDWLWEPLGKVAVELARAVPPDWYYAYLRDAAADKDPGKAVIAALVALEVLFGPLRADPLSESASINFHMISAANCSPLDGQIFEGAPPGDRSQKLAGNQLNNFAAFVSARWRHNDWIWGRLDAARSLVQLLTRPERMSPERLKQLAEDLKLKAPPDGIDRGALADAVVELLHRQILADEVPVLACLSDDPPSHFPRDPEASWSILGRIGWETIRDRLPSRRRPAARIGLVAWRALQPPGKVRLLFGLGKPLAIPLLLAVLAPLLTLLAATAWFTATTLLTGHGLTWGHVPVLLVAVAAVLSWASGDRLEAWLRSLPERVPKLIRCASKWALLGVFVVIVVPPVVAWYVRMDPPNNQRGQFGWLDGWTAVLVASGSILAAAWTGRSHFLPAAVPVALLAMWGWATGWLPPWAAVAAIAVALLAVGLLGGWRLAALGLGAAALVLPFALVPTWPFGWLDRLDGLLFIYAELSLLVALLTYLFPLGDDRQLGRNRS